MRRLAAMARISAVLGLVLSQGGCAAVAVVDTAVGAAATATGAAVDVTAGAVDLAVPDDADDAD